MATSWTTDQESVIKHRNGNLLVAAAAGSGKTAVLSERILSMLTDKDNEVDVDSLLVVTFTRAAAAEMKERIGKKITEYIIDNPDDRHMQRQSALLHNASITTIDSFCLQVVREFFHVIDMDPAFKIADESEMAILKNDIVEQLLEEKYEEGSEAFLQYSECYASGRDDSELSKQILKLYEASQSNPHPEEWLNNCTKNSFVNSVEEFEENIITRRIVEEIKRILLSLSKLAEKGVRLANEPDGPAKYESIFINEQRAILDAAQAESFVELSERVKGITFDRLPSKPGPDADKAETAKSLRKSYKDYINGKIIDKYFALPVEDIIKSNNASADAERLLIDLTLEFSERLMAAKVEKGMYSFNDIEHFALYILTKEEDGRPSPAADALRERYYEIIVDEYQDSNLLQETILNAISREKLVTEQYPDGQPNMFMVGDVKQSIYRFRRARPDLFMNKYDNYLPSGPYRKIMLRKNFRSRYQVLDSANTIFEWCMHREFGRIEYDSDASLYSGNTDYPDVENEMFNPELIIVTSSKENEDLLDNKKYREAFAAAEFIKSAMAEDSEFRVTKDKKLVKPSYGDFSILLRSTAEWTEMFSRVLSDAGIPVKAEVKTGFFDTGEVKTALNFLKCLDNPKQDISFVSLLFSPVLRMSNDEVANLLSKNEFAYDSVRKAVENKKNITNISENTMLRLEKFFEVFDYLKERKKVLSISGLLEEIYKVTGLYNLMLALPAGDRRAANLDFLHEQAVKFEKTSYCGLFNFIRYVENLREHEIDFGEASSSGTGDAVRIMTIHGSKGLEFPVVILPQFFKGFNDKDSKAAVVIHPEFGPTMDYINPELRTITKSLRKRFAADDLKRENIAEELRVYYVALTRAKEKLVVIGAEDKLEDKLKKNNSDGDCISYDAITGANSYFDFAKGCIFSGGDGEIAGIFADIAEKGYAKKELTSSTTHNSITWKITVKSGEGMPIYELAESAAIDNSEEIARKLLLGNYNKNASENRKDPDDTDKSGTEGGYAALEKAINFKYPYQKLVSEPLKHSVSELKHRAMQELGVDPTDGGQPAPWVKQFTDPEESDGASEDRKVTEGVNDSESTEVFEGMENTENTEKTIIPSKTKQNQGAERGTAMHRAMELLPMQGISDLRDVSNYLAGAVEKGTVEAEQVELINKFKVLAFTKTELYKDMAKAEAKGLLFREQPFVFGLPVEDGSEEDIHLIQGVIDAYYEDEDGLVILDYKTDRATEEILRLRYKVQLDLYANALSQITGKTVKKKLIYSFANEAVIEL